MNYLSRANELYDKLVEDRRHIHSQPETGMELPKTVAYVMEQLTSMGYEPREVGKCGVVATVGSGGRVFLLRADMDALPMKEESGEPFASTNGSAHACGHDLHTAMLLGAARMLKENESSLCGTVKLMFQPGEEVFMGARSMIEDGLLENPKIDAAFAIHVAPGPLPQGMLLYNDSTTMMCSADTFKIKIQGKGGHGSSPEVSIDPVNIAAHIVIALQEIIARETTASKLCVLTIGSIHAGSMANSIPDTAELMGSIRADSKEMRELMVKRMQEIATQTAAVFRGTAQVEMLAGTPPLVCNKENTDAMLRYIDELSIPGKALYPGMQANGSEDFSEITDRIPATYMMLSAGFGSGTEQYMPHHPKVRFNEATMPIGAAILANCATRWLEENSNK